MSNHKKLKKTLSKSDRESKKQKKNNRTVAIVMAVLMIASLAGIALSGFNSQSSNSAAFTYGDYSFKLQPIEGSLQSLLVTEVDGKEVQFYSLPQDTLQLDTVGNLSFLESTDYLVLTGNPDDVLMTIQDVLRYEMNQASGKSIGGAVMFPSENYTAYPVVTCLNSSTVVPVIEIVESNQTNIVVNGSCVKINSRPQDILYIRDRLLYQMLGIIR